MSGWPYFAAPATPEVTVPIRIREAPRLAVTHNIETPSGKWFRWAEDEPSPANVPGNVRFSDTMPGGYESADAVLPRKPERDYSDVGRLSTWHMWAADGSKVGEFRLEGAPKVSGSQMSVSPGAVGWQAHLEDDKSARMVYRDVDLSHWAAMSTAERVGLLTGGWQLDDPTTTADATNGTPALVLRTNPPFPKAQTEAWYDAGAGVTPAAVYYDFVAQAGVSTSWDLSVRNNTADDRTGSEDSSGDLMTASTSGAATFTFTTPRRFVFWVFQLNSAQTSGQDWEVHLRRLAVYGDHGLTLRGTEPAAGFFPSDIVSHAVQTWAPMLTVNPGGILPSGFVIPHLAFLDPTTAGEIVRQASRFDLPFWGVWDDREFTWDPNRTPRKNWRLRVAPSELEETGPSVSRLWESIIVAYQDVDGTTRTVGPPGSGANTEDSALKDSDSENPANQLGIIRRDILQMGVSTPAGAIAVGQRFLEESKLLDGSGRARVVGFVEDDKGVVWPYHKMRSGDTATFVDAADSSARRIVKTEKDVGSRTCSFDLDAPPQGLDALLARLGVVLVPLGFG